MIIIVNQVLLYTSFTPPKTKGKDVQESYTFTWPSLSLKLLSVYDIGHMIVYQH